MNGKQLKNSILQWAIQGKLVPQDPNDEPASVLLERIREEKARLVKEKKIKKDKNESIIFRGDDNSHYEKFADGRLKCIDDEIPFEIPQNWYWVRLGYIFSHCTGKALNGINKKGQLYQYITTSNLYWDRFELSSIKEMYFTEDELEKCTAKKGDLLVCEGGDIGRSAIWEYDYDIRIQNHIHKLRAYHQICTRFFYYILYLYKGIGNIGGKGIGIQGLSSGALHNILLPFPPLNEQQRIVSKIESLMPVVDNYEKSQESLDKLNTEIFDKLKKSVLQEAIQGKLVPQDPNDEPASVLLERIKEEKTKLFKEGKLKKKDLVDSVIFKGEDNKYYERIGSTTECIDDEIHFEVPSNWCWVRHNELFDIAGGSQPPKSAFIDTPKNGYIRLYQIRDYGPNPQPVYIPISSASKISQKGDILLARYGASLGKVFYAEDGAYNVAIAKVIPQYTGELIYKPYIYLYYCSSIYQKEIKDRSRCAQAGFNKEDLNSLLFPLPPYNEQKRIVEHYEFVIASIMRR